MLPEKGILVLLSALLVYAPISGKCRAFPPLSHTAQRAPPCPMQAA
jgi:hypothetical protein